MDLNRFAFSVFLLASPVCAGTTYDTHDAMVIGPDGSWAPSKCVQPSVAADTAAHYNQMQIYKTCVEAEVQNTIVMSQQDMANIDIIETDTPTSQNARDVIQRQTRSAAQRLGVDR